MQIVSGIDSFAKLNIGATAITVGSFDGVHGGHLSLLRTLCSKAQQRSLKSVVVSFTPHPRIALGRAEGLTLLTSDQEKALLLEEQGVDILLLLNFDAAFSSLSYEEFIANYLIRQANMQELIIGFNHQMGHDGGSFEQILSCSQKYNFSVTLAEEYSSMSDKVSSTSIRQAIEKGEIETANRLLSHPYLMIGQADIAGQVTFDLELKLLPPSGDYLAQINGEEQRVSIDRSGNVWCEEREKKVEIKLMKSYEKR